MTHNIEAINQWFKQVGERLVAFRWGIILALLGINVLALVGVPKIRLDNSTESWFLEDDPMTIARNEFVEMFGNDDYVAVLVEADDVFAPEMLRLIRKLGEELEENVPFADEVTSITDFDFTRSTEEGIEIGNIVPEVIPTDPQIIEELRALAFSKKFFVNRLFSDDSKQAWIFLRLNPFPDDWEKTLDEYPQLLVGREVLKTVNHQKYVQYTILPTAMPVMRYEEREFFAQEGNKLVAISVLIALPVLFAFLRTIKGVCVPMIVFISSGLWVFGTMGWFGIKVNNTVMTLPIFLGLTISIGYSIHIFNFFRRHFLATGKRYASVLYAVEQTGWPIFFTAITTVAALLSFYFVPIKHVRWMGLSSAAVVFVTYLMVMTIIPTCLSFGKDRSDGLHLQGEVHLNTIDGRHLQDGAHLKKGEVHLNTIDGHHLQGGAHLKSGAHLGRLGNWILNHPVPIIGIFVALVIFFIGGMMQVYVSMNYEETFGLKIPYIARLDYIGNTKIGAPYSYDLSLKFKEPDSVKDPNILKRFDLLSSEIKGFSLVKRVSSLLDIIKDMNQVMHDGNPTYYQIPDEKELIAQLLLLYEMSGGTEQERWVDYDYTTLRLLAEVKEFNTGEIEQEFEVLKRSVKELFPEAELNMAGTVVQFSVVQNYITKGEVVSTLIALVVIGLLMMIVLQSVKTGLIGMIPNIAPVFVVLGLMGYLNIPLDVVTMVVIPILLGLAVDDTIHFITHCKLEFQRTGNYRIAIQKTFQTVGNAIFMTSFIVVVAFSVYMLSVAVFFFHLSILFISGVIAALLADYFITPILVNLTKPFGEEPVKEEALSDEEIE